MFHFISLSPFSLTLLSLLPRDVLGHYAVELGRLLDGQRRKKKDDTNILYTMLRGEPANIRSFLEDYAKLED